VLLQILFTGPYTLLPSVQRKEREMVVLRITTDRIVMANVFGTLLT
jgi:hypothetical protein